MITISTNNDQLRYLYDELSKRNIEEDINEETQDMVSIKTMLDNFQLKAPEGAVSNILKYSREYDR